MKAIVFGAGGLCNAYMRDRYDERLYDIVAFSDNDSEKWGKEFYGRKIIAPAEICKLEYDIVVVASSFYEAIREKLVADYQIRAEAIVKMEVLEMSDVANRYNDYNKKNHKNIYGLDRTRGGGRVAIYTAITGDYDNLKNPLYIPKDCDYICFTDNPDLHSDVWDIRLIQNRQKDAVRTARFVKICPHRFLEDYDYSIWVDAKFLIKDNLLEIWEKYSCGSNMLNFLHYSNNNVVSQSKIVISAGYENRDIVEKQISEYQKEEGFDKNELIESGCIFRKHRESDVIEAMEMWWQEVYHKSHRDQLSLNYCLWKCNFIYDICPFHLYANHYLENRPHNKK